MTNPNKKDSIIARTVMDIAAEKAAKKTKDFLSMKQEWTEIIPAQVFMIDAVREEVERINDEALAIYERVYSVQAKPKTA